MAVMATKEKQVCCGPADAPASATVVSVAPAYAGLTLATDAVATTAESDLVRDMICSFFQDVPFPRLTVGLPHSTSYLRISGVPYWRGDYPMSAEYAHTMIHQHPVAQHAALARLP